MTSPHSRAGLALPLPAPADQFGRLGLWPVLAVFGGGLALHLLGKLGQAIALLGLLFIAWQLFSLVLRGRRWGFQHALLLGFLLNGEIFIRDFTLRGLPGGYLAVEYVVILLGVASLPALFARENRLLRAAPIWIFFSICLWDSVGLFYSEELWYGRITTGLHWAGLTCLLLGAVTFSRDDARHGLLDGIILGAFVSLGVMLRETLKSSSSLELDSGFRFGHALVSAVQVAIVLTTGMLAALIKLTSGYGKPWHAFAALALLAPFCIATFSRGPMLAFIVAALCLSLHRRRVGGWWKLPTAGLLLAGALLAVLWLLPSDFLSRYRDLQGAGERGVIWRVVAEMWKQSPVIGYGPGSWFAVYPRFASAAEHAPSRVSDAHNFILQAAVDGGIIGVGLFVVFVVAFLHRLARARSAIGLALFAFVLVNASLANFKLSVLFLLLGAGLGDCRAPRRLQARTISRTPSPRPVQFGPSPGSRRRWAKPAFRFSRVRRSSAPI